MCIRAASNGICVCQRLTTEGEPSFLGGFLSTSNHLAPDNSEGVVDLKTDAPFYWTVELQHDH